MFDVYFVNCFLLMALAFIAGYYTAAKKWQGAMVTLLTRGVTRVVTNEPSDVTKH